MVNSPIIVNNNHCSSVVDDTLVDLCFHGNDKALKKVDLNIFTLWSWIRFYVYDVIVDGSSTWKSSFLAWHSSSISSSSCLLTGWIKEPSGSNLKNEELLKLQYKNEESSSCWHCDHKCLNQSYSSLKGYLKSCSQKNIFSLHDN